MGIVSDSRTCFCSLQGDWLTLVYFAFRDRLCSCQKPIRPWITTSDAASVAKPAHSTQYLVPASCCTIHREKKHWDLLFGPLERNDTHVRDAFPSCQRNAEQMNSRRPTAPSENEHPHLADGDRFPPTACHGQLFRYWGPVHRCKRLPWPCRSRNLGISDP